MKNVYYTDEYQTHRRKYEAVFVAPPSSSNVYNLSNSYRLEENSYNGDVGDCYISATENLLINEQGDVLYKWRNLDDNCQFSKIIHHSDGSDYLIFRTDLYGYSVLNLKTFKDLHFYPDGSFPSGETFIWTDVFYNAENDVLLAAGCYWACPSGVILQDFKHPLNTPENWVDVHKVIDENYDKYDDIDVVEWRGSALVLLASCGKNGKKETLSIPKEQYSKWFVE